MEPMKYNIDEEEARAKYHQLIINEKNGNKTEAEKAAESGEKLLADYETNFGFNGLPKNPDKLKNKFARQSDRLTKRATRAAERGNNELAEKLFSKINTKADELTDDLSGTTDATTEGLDWGGAGLGALSKAPSLINNFSNKPTSGKEAGGKVLQSSMDFASIGGAVLPGWGHAIGAVVGAGTAAIAQKGWRDDRRDEEDLEVRMLEEEKRKELMDNYIANNTSKDIEAQKKIYASTLGYF